MRKTWLTIVCAGSLVCVGAGRAVQRFRTFHTAERTPGGVEAMHMMRKGRVKRLDGGDAPELAKSAL